jgi:hypothetical protein
MGSRALCSWPAPLGQRFPSSALTDDHQQAARKWHPSRDAFGGRSRGPVASSSNQTRARVLNVGIPLIFTFRHGAAYDGIHRDKSDKALSLINAARNIGASIVISVANNVPAQDRLWRTTFRISAPPQWRHSGLMQARASRLRSLRALIWSSLSARCGEGQLRQPHHLLLLNT